MSEEPDEFDEESELCASIAWAKVALEFNMGRERWTGRQLTREEQEQRLANAVEALRVYRDKKIGEARKQ